MTRFDDATAASAPSVSATIDGRTVTVPAGTTLLDACRRLGIEVPTLCYLETLAPVNVCRLCVLEVEGARTLVPACSRPVEDGMAVRTDSERVRHSRRMVLELLASAVDLSTAAPEVARWLERYGGRPERYGPPAAAAAAGERDARHAGEHVGAPVGVRETVAQPVKVDNALYVRDYAKCILCYKCVEACGEQAQASFAIAVAGRGFDARIATEFDVPLTESACVFCGNCIAVCPTGALMGTREHELRAEGLWAPERQSVTATICPYCGVGCTLELHVQDNRIVKVTSPFDADVTRGNLCIKGRFATTYVETTAAPTPAAGGGER